MTRQEYEQKLVDTVTQAVRDGLTAVVVFHGLIAVQMTIMELACQASVYAALRDTTLNVEKN